MAEVNTEYRLLVVHRCEGSFLASKHRGWPWTIYVHRTSTTRLKALPTGLRRGFHKLRLSIIQYTVTRENIQRSRTQSMWFVVVSWNDFTTNYCAIAMQPHGTDDIKERVHRINIEPHAICSYSVNEREFITSLRTRRKVWITLFLSYDEEYFIEQRRTIFVRYDGFQIPFIRKRYYVITK